MTNLTARGVLLQVAVWVFDGSDHSSPSQFIFNLESLSLPPFSLSTPSIANTFNFPSFLLHFHPKSSPFTQSFFFPINFISFLLLLLLQTHLTSLIHHTYLFPSLVLLLFTQFLHFLLQNFLLSF